ncbi:cytochrome P450 [Microbispora sp. KK1-11]|uniref:cytochrome P450 n=1 Tax=Microbispora sp. KK1-11 TaxID=2053005 RepID=UPI001C8D177F|nr:cytochrome P450 [Microbispora sp. KK1-11]
MVTRYDDVRDLLADSRFSTDADFASAEFHGAGLGWSPVGKIMAVADPPNHTRLRKLAAKSFTPRNVRIWREVLSEEIGVLLDSLEGRSEFDVVSDFAPEIPARALGRILGFEVHRHEYVAANAQAINSGDPERIPDAAKALLNLAEELIEIRRQAPGDDLITHLIAAREGEDRLSEDELVAMIANLVLGGYDTTQTFLANAILALLDHPHQQEVLRDDPGIASSAVEEFLRYEGSLTTLNWRFAKHELELAGTGLPAGAPVLAGVMSANRDASRFPDPDRLDLTRKDVRHLGLGHGIHNCIGAAMARLVAELAIPALVTRFPTISLAVPRSEINYRPSFFVRSIEALPLTVG